MARTQRALWSDSLSAWTTSATTADRYRPRSECEPEVTPLRQIALQWAHDPSIHGEAGDFTASSLRAPQDLAGGRVRPQPPTAPVGADHRGPTESLVPGGAGPLGSCSAATAGRKASRRRTAPLSAELPTERYGRRHITMAETASSYGCSVCRCVETLVRQAPA